MTEPVYPVHYKPSRLTVATSHFATVPGQTYNDITRWLLITLTVLVLHHRLAIWNCSPRYSNAFALNAP